MFNSGTSLDGIPSLTNPKFVDPDEVDFIDDDAAIMGVCLNGIARAYPETIGWRHEVINDVIGSRNIAGTLCPLTGTALLFDSTVDWEPLQFGVSGVLMNSNLIMYDRREFEREIGIGLWPQMIHTAIQGESQEAELELLPIVETTWTVWRSMHPDTQVAVPGTGLDNYSAVRKLTFSNRELYEFYPYHDYRTNGGIGFPLTTAEPDLDRFHPKATFLGICRNSVAKSYPFDDMPEEQMIPWQLDKMHFPNAMPPLESEFWTRFMHGMHLGMEHYEMPVQATTRVFNYWVYLGIFSVRAHGEIAGAGHAVGQGSDGLCAFSAGALGHGVAAGNKGIHPQVGDVRSGAGIDG